MCMGSVPGSNAPTPCSTHRRKWLGAAASRGEQNKGRALQRQLPGMVGALTPADDQLSRRFEARGLQQPPSETGTGYLLPSMQCPSRETDS